MRTVSHFSFYVSSHSYFQCLQCHVPHYQPCKFNSPKQLLSHESPARGPAQEHLQKAHPSFWFLKFSVATWRELNYSGLSHKCEAAHASQLTKVDSWQILQWSCCWSVVSSKWGLTKLQLCHSLSVGCLQTVHDWSTVGPPAHSFFQITIIAGGCCSPFSSIHAAVLPVVGDAAAPPHTAALQTLSLPDHQCDTCHQTRASHPTLRDWQFLQMPIKGQIHICNTTHCTVFSVFLIIHGTKRSSIKPAFVGGKGGGKGRVCNVPVRTPL